MSRASPLDVDFVRSHFPALETEWALLDNAGGSAPARQVIDRVAAHMAQRPVQLGADYPLSEEAAAAVAAGRAAAAELVGGAPGEVVLGPSSTVLVQLLARALRPLWREGDEVVVTNLDHETNIGPWRALEATGIVVREWCFRPESAALDPADLAPLLTDRTRLVAFTHCANVVGTIHDVAAAARLAREAGALTCVDGVAFAPHRRVDVRALGVDLYFLSFYKAYGPHLAMLWGRPDVLLAARGQDHFFVPEDAIPRKLEPGNVCYELAASLPGILEYLDAVDSHHHGKDGAEHPARLERVFDAIARHEAQVVSPLLEFLTAHPRTRVIGESSADPGRRVATVAFTVDGAPASAIPPLLEKRAVAVRWGHFYAQRAIRDMGLLDDDGVVRASLVHYSSTAEVERMIAALDDAL